MRNKPAAPAQSTDEEVKLDDSVGTKTQSDSKQPPEGRGASGQQLVLAGDKHDASDNTPPPTAPRWDDRQRGSGGYTSEVTLPPTDSGTRHDVGGRQPLPEGSGSIPTFDIKPDQASKGSGSGIPAFVLPDSPGSPQPTRIQQDPPPALPSGPTGDGHGLVVPPDAPPPDRPKGSSAGSGELKMPPPPPSAGSGRNPPSAGSGEQAPPTELVVPGTISLPSDPGTSAPRDGSGAGSGSSARPRTEIQPIAIPTGSGEPVRDPIKPIVPTPPDPPQPSTGSGAPSPEVGIDRAVPNTTPIGYRPGSTPQVKVYDEVRHLCAPTDTMQAISQKYYGDPRYADALLLHNRNHSLASPAIKSTPPDLRGVYIYVPDRPVLEEKYPQLINGPTGVSQPPGR
jgi:hypothetical protein